MFLITNYRKAILFISVFVINLSFFKFPILGSIWDFIAFIAIVLFIIQNDGIKIISHPLFKCMILPFLSVCISMHSFSIRYITETIVIYILPIVLFYSIKTERDIRFYVKCMIALLIMSILYCFYEEYTQTNPIMEWCYQHQEKFTWMTHRSINVQERFGFKRSQSFYAGEAAFASVCIYYWFIILMIRKSNWRVIKRPLQFSLLIILPFCVLLTGTRSAYIAFIIVAMSLISWNTFKNNKLLYITFACVIVLLIPYFNIIYDSIINSNNYEIGSSAEMREGQWDIAKSYMTKNLWFGNGLGYHAELLKSNVPGIYGLEGMWLPIMINRGLFGVISVTAGYIITLIYLIKKKQYSLIWVLVSFLTFKTITTVAGVEQTYYLYIIVFLIRFYDIKKEDTTYKSAFSSLE